MTKKRLNIFQALFFVGLLLPTSENFERLQGAKVDIRIKFLFCQFYW